MDITVRLPDMHLAPDAAIQVSDQLVVRGRDGRPIQGATVESVTPTPEGLIVTLRLPAPEPTPGYMEITAEELVEGDTILPWEGEVEIAGTWIVNDAPLREPIPSTTADVQYRMLIPTDRGTLRRPRNEKVRIQPREQEA